MELFERAENLAQEKIIIDRFCELYRIRAIKLNMSYSLDYMLIGKTQDTCLGVAECKARDLNFAELPHVILSVKKYERLSWWCRSFLTEAKKQMTCMFLVKFLDGFFGYKYNPDHTFTIRIGGRNNLRNELDREPVVLIPRQAFKEF